MSALAEAAAAKVGGVATRSAADGDPSVLVVVVDTDAASWAGRTGAVESAKAAAPRALGGSWHVVGTTEDASQRSEGAAATGKASLSDLGGATIGKELTPHAGQVQFADAVAAVLVFANLFRTINRENKLVVIANGRATSEFVTPKAGVDGDRPMKEVLEGLNKSFEKHIGASDRGSGSLSSSLGQALCYIQRLRREDSTLQARILVVQAGSDAAALYVATMNCIFCCEKIKVPIDSCALTSQHSAVLQQAAFKTKGSYFRPTEADEAIALTQMLVSWFLPDEFSRRVLARPPESAQVDMRAACFCHRQTQDQAFVCPVCLSIWCMRSKKCAVCGAVAPGVGEATQTYKLPAMLGHAGGGAGDTGDADMGYRSNCNQGT